MMIKIEKAKTKRTIVHFICQEREMKKNMTSDDYLTTILHYMLHYNEEDMVTLLKTRWKVMFRQQVMSRVLFQKKRLEARPECKVWHRIFSPSCSALQSVHLAG